MKRPTKFYLAASCACAALVSCGHAPTKERHGEEVSGSAAARHPVSSDAQNAAHTLMVGYLIDPQAAKWECGQIQKGTMSSGKIGDYSEGWILPCDIDGKNKFGAYQGPQKYGFLFINSELVRAAQYGHNGGTFSTSRPFYDK